MMTRPATRVTQSIPQRRELDRGLLRAPIRAAGMTADDVDALRQSSESGLSLRSHSRGLGSVLPARHDLAWTEEGGYGIQAAGRNDPCPCGSGRKAKRCCGVRGGPSEEQLARAYLAGEARRAAIELRRSPAPFGELFDRLLELPELDLSLVLPLPDILSPDLNRLLDAVARDDPDAGEPYLQAELDRLDTLETRVRLARAARALADAGRVEPAVAALAMIDLEGGGRALLRASLIQAAAIATGTARTPGGLLVAAA